MTEPEEIEEDLFADLYDGDDAPAPAVSANPTVSAQPNFPPPNDEPDIPYVDPVLESSEGRPSNGAGTSVLPQIGIREREDVPMNHEPFSGIKEDGKMFIGGLNWETTDQSLRDYFAQFGEVLEGNVMRDGATGRSRGFGFLTFRDPKTVNTVMVKEHFLDGKIIDPKRAIPRDEQEKTSKIFVGGVSQEASEHDFKDFFNQFGRVIDATLMMDKDTGRPRGFGFVTFDSEAAVEKCLEQQPLEILGKMIEVKKAQPRGKMVEEEDNRGRGRGKFGRNEDRFSDNASQSQQGQNQGGRNNNGGGSNDMSPQMMAQYWQRMQQYFAMMQQSMMGNMMNQQMNPQMLAQMQQMQAMKMQQAQGGGGMSPNPQSPNAAMAGMTPQMQQQMMQMMQSQQGPGAAANNNNGPTPPTGPSASRPGAFSANEQMAFEQQKYEQQAQFGRQQGGGGPNGPNGPGFHRNHHNNHHQNHNNHHPNSNNNPTSWEGMYDDVPAPNAKPTGPIRNPTPHNVRGKPGSGTSTPGPGVPGAPQGPSNAPENAPKGPKNAGRPGANFRGGRGGRFHPYGR